MRGSQAGDALRWRRSVLVAPARKAMRYAGQHSILSMPDISQAGKKDGSHLTRKERVSALVGRTVEAYLSDAFVEVPVAGGIRTGNIHDNATAPTFLWHQASRSLPKPLMTGCASGYGLQSRGALVTGPLKNVEEGSIRIGRAQQVVIATDFLNGRWREGHPPRASPTEQPLMQTTVVQGHRIYLSGFHGYMWIAQ